MIWATTMSMNETEFRLELDDISNQLNVDMTAPQDEVLLTIKSVCDRVLSSGTLLVAEISIYNKCTIEVAFIATDNHVGYIHRMHFPWLKGHVQGPKGQQLDPLSDYDRAMKGI